MSGVHHRNMDNGNRLSAAIVLAAIVGLLAGCSSSSNPSPSTTQVRETSTTFVAAPPPETPRTTVAPPPPASSTTKPGLQPGPHSAVADVDLPEGTVQCTTVFCTTDQPSRDPHEESWRYSAPYDDVLEFLRERFATGRQYDTRGATWWKGLPPCYDDKHQSPPWGWTLGDDDTAWRWSDGSIMLTVFVIKQGSKQGDGSILPFGRIDIWQHFGPEGDMCFRA